jgi:hypothetical protein
MGKPATDLSSQSTPDALRDSVWNYPLMDAITHRRSRRFSRGASLNGGGLAYDSLQAPLALSAMEEAMLVVAAAGVTGYVTGELPYGTGAQPESGGGNVMVTLTGRTGASADAVHGTALFVLNDEGTYLIKRPQDFAKLEIGELGKLATERRVEELYQRQRVRLSDKRLSIPRKVPHMFPFNKWSTNVAGSTYFLPVSDMTAMYINLLLSTFDEQLAGFIVDDRNGYSPAGIADFGRSRGKQLYDDPDHKRTGTVLFAETTVAQFMLAEQAFMGHNLSLVEQAMGLGGWTHFATADTSWFEALGFRMAAQPLSKAMGAGFLKTLLLKLINKDIPIPFPLGLETLGEGGQPLLRPYCPPYYRSMEEAVLAFVDFKMSETHGTLKDGSEANLWKNPGAVEAEIPKYSDNCIAATIAYCDYIYKRYGRFPAYFGTYITTLAHQAHHLDLDFYDRFYKPGAYTETQAHHMEHWH